MFSGIVKAVKNWWLLLILGILCVICGIAVFCTPASGLGVLSGILMISLIGGGLLIIIFIISNRDVIPAWGWDLILGILVLISGIVLACYPAATAVLVVVIFSIGCLFRSLQTIVYAIQLSKIKGSGWGWTLVVGIIGLLISFTLLVYPLITGMVINFLVGFALLFMGIGAIAVSIQLSKIKGEAKRVESAIEDAINK